MTTPTESQPSLFVGTFVDIEARGYLEPTGQELALIQRLLVDEPKPTGASRTFWNDLYLIKLLAPEESKDLVIFAHDRVNHTLEHIAKSLVYRYYTRGRR